MLAGVPYQQMRHSRRLYVGGMEGVPKDEVEALFTNISRTCALRTLPTAPVLSVFISEERKFAFVEMCSLELTTALMALNGSLYKERNLLKLARPTDYQPSAMPAELRDRAEPMDWGKLAASGIPLTLP